MGDEALAAPDDPLDTTNERTAPAADAGTSDVSIAAVMVDEAGQALEALRRFATRHRENLSAAERLLAELDAAPVKET